MSATTPIYGWPYQTLADPPDGPNLGQDLALAIESTMDSLDDRIDVNEAELDTLDAVRLRCGVRLRRVANQSINNITTTNISWDTEDQDTDGFITAPGTTITVPAGKGGIYAVLYRVDYQLGLTNAGRNFLSINIASANTGVPASFRSRIDVTEDFGNVDIVLPLLAGSTIICDTFHTEGSAKNVIAWLSAYRIGV